MWHSINFSASFVILPHRLAVTLITALKDGYEDIKRHHSDKAVNHSVVHTLTGPNVENTNPMRTKTKTFVKGMKLPQSRKKRALKAQEKEAWELLVMDDMSGNRDQGGLDEGARREERLRRMNEADAEHDIEAVEEEEGVASKTGWKRTFWEDVRVGDFVKVSLPPFFLACSSRIAEIGLPACRYTTTRVSLLVRACL